MNDVDLQTRRWSLWWDTGLLTILAAAVRFYRLGFQSFWLDEVTCTRDVSRSLAEIWNQVVSSPPLYHYLVHFVYIIAGKDPFWLRVPSAVFGALLVPLFYWSLNRSFDRRTAFWGALVLAVSPFHLWYSQEMRMYSLLALEAFLSMHYWQKSLEEDRPRDWAGYVLASLAGLYTHNWFVFLTGAQVLWGYLEAYFWRRRLRSFTLSLLVIGLFYAPWVPWMIDHQLFHHTLSFLENPTWRDLVSTFLSFSPTGGILFEWHFPAEFLFPYLHITAPVLLTAVFLCAFFRRDSRLQTIRHLTVGIIFPLTFAFIFSVSVKPIYLAHRYVILCLPSFLWIAAVGFSVKYKPLGALLKLTWLAISLYVLSIYFTGGWSKAHWKDMSLDISASAAENILTSNMSTGDSLCLAFYMTERAGRVMDWDQAVLIPGYIADLTFGGSGLVAAPVPKENTDAFLKRINQDWTIISSKDFTEHSVFYIKRNVAIAEGA